MRCTSLAGWRRWGRWRPAAVSISTRDWLGRWWSVPCPPTFLRMASFQS
jgi:hypothetical protein